MDPARATILLVEDDEPNATVYTRCLENEGYVVTVAGNGREAIQRLNRETFDVVLTDMLMPHGDGIALLNHIRELPERPAVITMSGGGTHLTASQLLSWAVSLGALAPLVKPFTRDQLLGAVASVLRH